MTELSFEERVNAALVRYIHEVQPYIDFTPSCPYEDEHQHYDIDDLAHDLAKLDRGEEVEHG